MQTFHSDRQSRSKTFKSHLCQNKQQLGMRQANMPKWQAARKKKSIFKKSTENREKRQEIPARAQFIAQFTLSLA